MTSKLTIVIEKEPPRSAMPAAEQSAVISADTISGEEIAKLWMNENNVVNQKAAYFTAVNLALVGALVAVHGENHQHLLAKAIPIVCLTGFAVSMVAFLSIARTCAYRQHFRRLLNEMPGYRLALRLDFKLYERVTSNHLLTITPLLAAIGWAALLCKGAG